MTHPIIPPQELVQQWQKAPEFSALSPCVLVTVTTTKLQDIATSAAQWGSDQELEACCEWLKLEGHEHEHEALLAARRPKPPKPPSLKEQALQALAEADIGLTELEWPQCSDTIRRALEQLPDNN